MFPDLVAGSPAVQKFLGRIGKPRQRDARSSITLPANRARRVPINSLFAAASRRAHTLWLPHFPHRSRFTKLAIGAS
jgi:hypothetical protein